MLHVFCQVHHTFQYLSAWSFLLCRFVCQITSFTSSFLSFARALEFHLLMAFLSVCCVIRGKRSGYSYMFVLWPLLPIQPVLLCFPFPIWDVSCAGQGNVSDVTLPSSNQQIGWLDFGPFQPPGLLGDWDYAEWNTNAVGSMLVIKLLGMGWILGWWLPWAVSLSD